MFRICTIFMLLLAMSRPVAADMVNLVPVADGYVEDARNDGDSDFDTIDTNSTIYLHLEVIQGVTDTELRGVVEFDITSIPVGSTIISAQLVLVTAPLGGAAGPLCDVYGYAGDGSIDLGDALAGVSLTPPSTFAPSMVPGTTNYLDIQTGFIQSLTDAGESYAGFTMRPVNSDRHIYFDALETGVAPALNVEYTAIPEPGTIALLGLGALGLIGRRKRNI